MRKILLWFCERGILEDSVEYDLRGVWVDVGMGFERGGEVVGMMGNVVVEVDELVDRVLERKGLVGVFMVEVLEVMVELF